MATPSKALQEWIRRHEEAVFLILGFGLEGQSTYQFLRRFFIENKIYVMDQQSQGVEHYFATTLDEQTHIIASNDYLKVPEDVTCVFKSPGIGVMKLEMIPIALMTSQTEVFLEILGHKTIGITGTKGKSTTASLIYTLLKAGGKAVSLVGNIGQPALECIDEDVDWYIYELSSHQLELTRFSPHISVLLNVFEEHLDHYYSYKHYREAKLNIGRFQTSTDCFIVDTDNQEVLTGIDGFHGQIIKIGHWDNYSWQKVLTNNLKTQLLGTHNLRNIGCAFAVLSQIGIGIDASILQALEEFKGLKHRLELIGTYKGITFYNDSISTIPEATIAAVKAIGHVDVLFLGGMDRGIDYSELIEFVNANLSMKLILLPDTGHYLAPSIHNDARKFLVKSIEEGVKMTYQIGGEQSICLLSPAAASYGFYKNFEARGDDYRHWVTLGNSG